MTLRSRLLAGVDSPPPSSSSTSSVSSPPSSIKTIDPDFAVILAALLCALICVLGLVAVARCAWIRRLSSFGGQSGQGAVGANKGVKKKVLKSLPSHKFGDEDEQEGKLSECPICLTDFAAGEEVRVLPQCGHGFHIDCIDMWLASHSSCPSCRQVLVASTKRCQKCGGSGSTSGNGLQPEPRENHVNSFLP